jgi:2-polyprenyl-6-hydroxyphenyl methylase / 3-demethylubiquinone-9 3-methyltransferase
MESAARPAPVDEVEVEKFSGLAADWWDPFGPMAPLHAMNPTRVRYVRDRLCAHFQRDATAKAPLAGLRLLDVGCGAGLLCEPLARLGAAVTGIDASVAAIEAARAHANGVGVAVAYRVATAAELGATFDGVLAMEVVEHVPDLVAFVGEAATALAEGGLFLAATLNRTLRSYAMAIVGAEYVLRWVPRGTHDWQKFVRPAEFARALRTHGLRVADLTGVKFEASTATFALTRDVEVNYLLSATR